MLMTPLHTHARDAWYVRCATLQDQYLNTVPFMDKIKEQYDANAKLKK
jgi:hypothetical protein